MQPRPQSYDIFSTLTSSIIETILCLVSIKEAARTSILSREWRYKWTKIPKLVFYDSLFEEPTDDENQLSDSEQTIASERKRMGNRCKLFYAIYQVLLMRQGPIYKFTLSLEADKTCVEIDPIISYLSKNNDVKTLKLHLYEEEREYYWLPLSFFSLHHLTNLHLEDCNLNRQPTFNGFSRLTSLNLKNVIISRKTLLHLLSNSPLLRNCTLIISEEDLVDDDNSTIIELFECLPAVEHLTTYSRFILCYVLESVPQELPTSLTQLKYFHLDFMTFALADELRFLALLIRCSPNLEKIMLEIGTGYVDDRLVSVIREAYSDIRLDHLIELKIYGFENMKAELEFVKFMLAKSPKLKKVDLCFENVIAKNEESEILRTLLHSPPASPVVRIIVRSE